MKSIHMFIDEFSMEWRLKDAYKECWNRLLKAIPLISMEELEQLSNPFLVKCLPSYRKANRKVLFIGQETNGWDSFKVTLDTFSNTNAESNRDDIINYLQWMYEDLRYQRKWDHTPFWRGVRRLYQAISPGQGDDGFLHTELVRFDLNKKRPPHHIEELLQREYNVLPMEIKALSPDVIVFVTGPYYDERIRETFRNVGRVGDHIIFEAIPGFSENALVRVSHPDLPYHTYRTYHPNYSLQRFDKSVFVPIENAIKDFIQTP